MLPKYGIVKYAEFPQIQSGVMALEEIGSALISYYYCYYYYFCAINLVSLVSVDSWEMLSNNLNQGIILVTLLRQL